MSASLEQGALGPESRPCGEASASDPVTILYTNWRGETAVRRIVPGSEHPGLGALWLGESEWHPGIQWLLAARDVEKDAHRVFALSGIKAWGQAAVDAALSASAPASGAERMTAGGETQPAALYFAVGQAIVDTILPGREADFVSSVPSIRAVAEAAVAAVRRSATPAPATPPGVPDSVRALLGKAHNALHSAKGALNEAGRREKVPGRSLKLYGAAEECEQAIFSISEILATHPAGQSAGSGAVKPDPIRLMKEALFACLAEGTHDRNYGGVLAAGGKKAWLRFSVVDAETSALADGKLAPDSTRTGDEGTEKRLQELFERCVAEASRATDKAVGEVCRWYVEQALTARPAAPAAWRPIAEAPKDGTEIWAWLYDSGVRKLRWWSAEEICEEEGRNTPEAYQAGFYEVADRTEWWNPAWWLPADRLPAPPSSSGQEG